MKLIIDTSSIISSLIKNGASRKILFSEEFTFITPNHTLKEIFKYKDLICKKAKITTHEFHILFTYIFENITIRPEEEYKKFYNNAKYLINDEDDIPFIALYLSTKSDGI
jgi:predicted nucleic acid-binding protein